MSQIKALPGAHRPIDAVKFITEMVKNENVKGIILATIIVEKDGREAVDKRIFGDIHRSNLATTIMDLQCIYMDDWNDE